MNNYKIKFLNITVRCPLDEFGLHKYPIQMREIIWDDGVRYFENSSCDMMSGSIVCDKCRHALNVMFNKGYRPDHYEVVTPDFSIYRSHNEEPTDQPQ